MNAIRFGKLVEDYSDVVREKYGLDSFQMYFRTDGVLYLDRIIVKKGERKRGIGTAVLEEVTRFADAHGLMMQLMPATRDDYFGSTSRARLVRFYKRFGFVENKGRHRDFGIGHDVMYRMPRKP